MAYKHLTDINLDFDIDDIQVDVDKENEVILLSFFKNCHWQDEIKLSYKENNNE